MLSRPEALLFLYSLMHLRSSSMVVFSEFIGGVSCITVRVSFIDTMGG